MITSEVAADNIDIKPRKSLKNDWDGVDSKDVLNEDR